VTDDVRNVIVVGSGPAGLTAAIYTARAALDPLVIEGEPSSTSDQPGGQLMLTTDVENFPGFPAGITGPELMGSFRAQAERFGSEIVTAKVTRLDLSSPPFGVWVGGDDGEPTHRARSIIIATGASSLMLGIDAERRLLGHGLSTCATCDGFFFRGRKVAVIGGGNSAVEEALYLSNLAAHVTVIHRREGFRAEKILQQRLFAKPNVTVLWHRVVEEFLAGEGKFKALRALRLKDTRSAETSELPVDGAFVAIGHAPATALFRGQMAMDSAGYIETVPGTTRTSIPGIFAAGDVQDKVYRQAVTAAGTGCMAALDAEKYLASLEAGREAA
jgi:thioredoxin reductase (NADPH)